MDGQRVGHYRIIEKIGAGGMGEVFRARDERLGRDVALKFIRPASTENIDHLRRFELEARAAASLNHPNIVAIYDIGFEQGQPYIVSELLEGQTLRHRLSTGPMPLREVLTCALQIVQGLIAAHQHHIVHRDLKPENLFLTREDRIKILDFGVAKLQSPASSESGPNSVQSMTTLTKSGSVLGTVGYMSPEQLRGKAIDSRCDIFSFGAILYEMLTGKRAFSGETEVDTITAVLREDPPEIDLKATKIPAGFQEITRHCLEKDPERRFQSARDLAFALQTLSGSGETMAVRPASKQRRQTTILPWAMAAMLGTAVLLLLIHPLKKSSPPVTYRKLTFEQGTVYSARFASDGRTILYGAAWNGMPRQLYSTVGNSLLSQPLSLTGADLLAISPTNELALAIQGWHGAHLESQNAVLARAPMAAGSPRQVLKDVDWADWDSKGDLAVVHDTEGESRLEYPIGHVLFSSSGWIGNIRFSPQGNKIAFLNHPLLWDDRASVTVLDLSGKVTTLSSDWESADGLAWAATGKEVWFTATEKGNGRALRAVDLGGNLRTVYNPPGSLTLQDISSDGQVLITLDSISMGMDSVEDGKDEVDLSWHDWNIPKDISHDGKTVLFEDSSEAAGPNFAVAARDANGDLPTRLGEGTAGGLSPDGKWAISISGDKSQNLLLLPVAAGQPRKVGTANLEHISNSGAQFLEDGERLVFNANEPARAERCFVLDLSGGSPVPLTPEGTACGVTSADSRQVVAFEPNGSLSIYAIGDSVTLHRVLHANPAFQPVQWSEDGRSLYGYHLGELPGRVFRLEIADGQETLMKQLKPVLRAGVVRIGPVVVSRNAKHIVYSYLQYISTLYLFSGLR